ncbi:MAG: peptidylprolyl isomerase [Frankiales bacterium]|nr:peptidylprolyl isomerase [Frankiales bacterium]
MASTKREKELARQRAERQAARRAAAAQRRKQRNVVIASAAAVLLVAVAAVTLGVVASGGDDADVVTPAAAATPAASTEPSAAPSGSAEPSASAASDEAGTCTYEKTSEPAAKQVALPPGTDVEFEQVFTVTMATNRGDVVFDMDSAEAPCTANSLRSLAHFAYFDDTPCHRLTTEGIKVLQCGDPSGTGGGGPGYQFADENLEGASYPRGTVAMANAGEGTNGSQFFLVYEDSQLPPNYTPFGVITEGLEVLEEVAAGGSDESNGTGDGKPKLPVQVETLRVAPKAA